MSSLVFAASVSSQGFDLVDPHQAPLYTPEATMQMFPNPKITFGDVYIDKELAKPGEPIEIIVISAKDRNDPHYNDDNNVCKDHYTSTIRDVTEDGAKEVFNLYNSEFPNQWPKNRGQYEVDHFLSLEIGGSNCIKAGDILPAEIDKSLGHNKGKVIIPAHTCKSGNLWTQPYNPNLKADDVPGARLKDQVEDELKRRVCDEGSMDIHDAQAAFMGSNPVTGKSLVINGQEITNWYDFFYYEMYLKDKEKYAGWLKTDDKGEEVK
jgi:hypothetical protein